MPGFRELAAEPLTDRCKQILAIGDHAIIGVSPFNSYFTEPTIARIIEWCQAHFSRFDLYLPDKPNEYTLLALGYSASKARRKARRQANYMRNRIIAALTIAGLPPSPPKERIVDHGALDHNQDYQAAYAATKDLFALDRSFRNGIVQASSEAIARKADHQGCDASLSAESIRISSEYLLAELPIMTADDRMLDRKYSAFCYH